MELCDEWMQWRAFLQQLPSVPTKPSPLKLLQIMKEYNLLSGFPNVCIALRVYLTLPVSNCSGERSFSHLKRIKNAPRSTIAQDRLTNLTLMNIECEIVQALDFQDLVDSFAIVKARRQQLNFDINFLLGAYQWRIQGGQIRPWPPSKLAMEFAPLRDRKSNGSIVILLKSKDFAPPRIDVGYGFGPP